MVCSGSNLKWKWINGHQDESCDNILHPISLPNGWRWYTIGGKNVFPGSAGGAYAMAISTVSQTPVDFLGELIVDGKLTQEIADQPDHPVHVTFTWTHEYLSDNGINIEDVVQFLN